MVSTREILYVLLISLAAGGAYMGGEGEPGGYPGGISGLLPLLLLLLFSTDTPAGCGCCNVAPRVGNCPNRF